MDSRQIAIVGKKTSMKRLDFLLEGIKNIKTTGTFTRSSRHLCRSIIKEINFNEATYIVELGAGDGVITRHLLDKMKQNATLFAFEIHPPFLEILKQIDDPRLVIIEENALHIQKILSNKGVTEIDCIISGLPFVNFPEKMALDIISACKNVLKNRGTYIQFHYSLLAKKLYEKIFGNVKISLQVLNFPPAFIFKSINILD